MVDRRVIIFQIEDMLSKINKEKLLKFGGHIDNGSAFLELMTNMLTLLKEHEPKTSKWILDDDDANSWKCSECGGLSIINDGTPHENNWYFCPYCGTKLEDEKVGLDD